MVDQFEFSAEDFSFLREIVFEHAGINLNESKQMLVYNRLVKRLRTLALPNFKAYCELLKNGDTAEHRIFIDAVTTTVTAFFRENHHFEFLKSDILPELLERKRKQNNRTLRIWSAGCSIGQEAYSIAIAVSEAVPVADWHVEILATDLNQEALSTAKAGIYPENSIDDISQARKKRWFRKGKGDKKGYIQVKPELQKLITFKKLNLVKPWALPYIFDIIFCRNVVIYFNKDIQRALFDRFYNSLESDGIMIIGHSESLDTVNRNFYRIGKTVYRKKKVGV